MRKISTPVSILIVVAMCACANDAKPHWIELSHKYDNNTIVWPGGARFIHKLVFKGQKQLFYYSSYDISSSEHCGTHIDSPIHFAEGKWTTDQIPLDVLIGDAIVVNITDKALKNPDAQCTVDDLKTWEKANGRIPDDVILLLNTGWGRYWPDRKNYLGTESLNTSLLHFPGLHGDAAKWLVKNRKIKLFGIDTASIDYGQSVDFITHQVLFKENIPALENVAHMEKLPIKGSRVYAAPQYIKDGSGGPCRVFAQLNKPVPSSAKYTFAPSFLLIVVSCVYKLIA